MRLQRDSKRCVLFGSICAASLVASAESSDRREGAEKADARARLIVEQMTLEEKIQELHGIFDPTHFRVVAGIPRLGIPDLNITNGPAGATMGGPGHQGPATALPSPISLAATWDTHLAYRHGSVIGSEANALANGLVEAPDINIARVPQNGRSFEGFGEDPYLVGEITVAHIRGIQDQGVIANVKHYAGNNQEAQRLTIDAAIDERTLREVYLPGFEAAVTRGRVGSLMCAYNRVNGTFNCENDVLLNQIVKGEWGFQGFITSDFGAVHSTVPSALAGLDLEMPTGAYFGDALMAAVESGEVPMSIIDDKLVRRFRTMILFGVFDNPPTKRPIPAERHGAIARQLAEEGMVLLKNDGGALPLSAEGLRSIAVIGPYAYAAVTGGGGSSHVTPLYTVDPVEGIQNRVGPKVVVRFDDGGDVCKAAAIARSADAAIVMVGDEEGEGRDHAISLSGNQDELVKAVTAANPRTVVVIKSGAPVLMPWIERVPAIVEAWYPGEEDGNAVAAVLFGDSNPSGKLPITFPRSLDDVPAHTPEQYPGVDGVAHYSEGVFVGYRHYDARGIEPLFSFGHGLSYTSFSYQNLAVTPRGPSAQDGIAIMVLVDLDVTNTGDRTGAEVVQLYLALPATKEVPQPPKGLKGFRKIHLHAGETAHVQFALDARSLSYWDVGTHRWAIAPGNYQVMVGSSSRDIRQQGTFNVTSQ